MTRRSSASAPETAAGAGARAHAARLAEALRFSRNADLRELASVRRPAQERPARSDPGCCKGKAHDADHLGYAGRRVLVSRKWSGKTLADHRAGRQEWLLSTLGVFGNRPVPVRLGGGRARRPGSHGSRAAAAARRHRACSMANRACRGQTSSAGQRRYLAGWEGCVMANQRDELMTVEQILAELCGVSERTFYRWRELGRAPKGIRLPNRELRVWRSEFLAWLEYTQGGRGVNDTTRVQFWDVRRNKSSMSASYEVRWVVGGRQFSRTRATKALAEDCLSELRQAAKRGEAFDISEGLPVSMRRAKHAGSWFAFVLAYVDMKWPRAAATTRNSMTDALATVTAALVDDRPGQPEVVLLRRALRQYALVPSSRTLPRPAEVAAALGWLERASLPLTELEKPRNVRLALDALTVRLDGTLAAATTIHRKRSVFYNVLGYAAELEELRQIR